MSRKSDELILVRNLIDFDEKSVKTPRHVVEWWALSRFDMMTETPPRDGFTYSPLKYFVNFLKASTAEAVIADYMSAANVTRGAFFEEVFMAHCRAAFRSHASLQIRAPRQFVFSEIHCAILDLTREINQHADVTNEDMEEWMTSKKF